MKTKIDIPIIQGTVPVRAEIYVVVGDGPLAGHIKTVRVAKHISSDLIRCEWKKGETSRGSVYRLTEVNINSDLRDRGWFFLEDAYREEDRMDDFEAWKSFQAACAQGMVEKPRKDDESITPGFPDELLPKKVLEARKHGKTRGFWQPPEKKSKKRGGSKASGEVELPSEL